MRMQSEKSRFSSLQRMPRRLAGCAALAAAAFALFIAPASLTAEVIQLKNGTFIEGRIVSQDQKRIVLKTANGQQRVVNKSTIRRIVYDAGLGARLIAEQKRKQQAARDAERNKALEAERARKAAELAKQKEQEAAKNAAREAERQRREAREARQQYAAAFQDYERRARAESERLAREEELRKNQEAAEKEEQELAENQTDESEAVRIDRWGALWRSAILPGWGQFYADQPVMGTAYSGLFAFAAVNSYNLRRIALSSRNDYTSFTDTSFLVPLLPGAGIPAAAVVYFETSRRSETYSRNVKRQQQSVQLLGGIYLVQLIHAAFLSAEVSTALLLDPADSESGASGVSLFADQAPLDQRDQILGAGRDGLDSRVGLGYSLRF